MRLLVLSGPTGVGKTALSLALAEALDAEIINADSTQVYKGLDIATAKISPEEQTVPHHLLDLVNPDEEFTLYDYQSRAFSAIKEIAQRGRLPFLVGGSGLYIKAVTDGLNLPYAPPDPEFRTRLRSVFGYNFPAPGTDWIGLPPHNSRKPG